MDNNVCAVRTTKTCISTKEGTVVTLDKIKRIGDKAEVVNFLEKVVKRIAYAKVHEVNSGSYIPPYFCMLCHIHGIAKDMVASL